MCNSVLFVFFICGTFLQYLFLLCMYIFYFDVVIHVKWLSKFIAAQAELDDDFLRDQKYAELFTETYLLPAQGHRVFVVQPGMCRYKFCLFTEIWCSIAWNWFCTLYAEAIVAVAIECINFFLQPQDQCSNITQQLQLFSTFAICSSSLVKILAVHIFLLHWIWMTNWSAAFWHYFISVFFIINSDSGADINDVSNPCSTKLNG